METSMIVNPRVKDFAILFLAGFALVGMYEAVRCHEREQKPTFELRPGPPVGNPAPVPPPAKESASR